MSCAMSRAFMAVNRIHLGGFREYLFKQKMDSLPEALRLLASRTYPFRIWGFGFKACVSFRSRPAY